MRGDPKFVRLAEHLTDVTQADIAGGSGWSISGNAVVPFPEGNEDAARYVRQRLAVGVLEPAGQAEYTEQEDANEELAALTNASESGQENKVQLASTKVRGTRRATAKARARAASDEESEEDSDN